MTNHKDQLDNASSIPDMNTSNWGAINPEYVARMRMQNKFKTGIDIAKYTAGIMRRDMDSYDNDTSAYTQSLGCWHGFIGQQKLISIKKHFNSLKGKLLKKLTKVDLIDKIYTYVYNNFVNKIN